MLKVATLFSGIGTPEQSLTHLQVEHETIFACEIDKYARTTYLANNQTPNTFYEDVTKLDAIKYKNKIDILVGGFPCQAFSIAGKQLGFLDTRGTLFFDVARIIKECIPKVFILENVKGLISHDKPKTPNCLFKKYVWKQNMESNQNVFFDHNFLLQRTYDKKEKTHKYIFKDKVGVFIDKVFYSKGYPSHFNKDYDGHKKGIGKTLYTIENIMLDFGYKTIVWDIVNTKDYLVPQNRERIYIVGFKDEVEFEFAPKQELKLRLKDMLEDEVDKKYLLNQELILKYLETGTASNHKGSQAGKVADETDETFWTVNAGTHGYSMGYIKLKQTHTLNIKGNDSIKRIYSSEGLCPSLTTMQGGHREPKVAIQKEIIKLFDIPKEILNDNERQRRVYSPEGISPAVIARSDSAKILQNTNSKVAIANEVIEIGNDEERTKETQKTNYIFRKLTPRECFRLQGFDDSFIFPSKMSDTQLYKQAGNGMSRNILDMIFTQIFTCYAKHIEKQN